MKIYNSLTKKKQEFVPIYKDRVGMYVCGPTVYGPPHVGHARSYVNFDMIRRTFIELGYKVKFVENITDVGHLVGDGDDGEDKILVQSKRENIDPYEIAYKYECMFFDAMDKLNVLRPSISARATAFIPEMIEMVKELVASGHAYVTKQNNVYFSVRSYPRYGQLSNRKLDNALSGERIEVAGDKKAPEDFALWKSAEGGHIMKWDSPWGMGYPGWHLECSTMSRKFLGKTFDIHGGGIDNMFPHHECEFAQSETVNNAPFVNYFVHNNLVTVNGTKMGKSLGNFITLDDLFSEFEPEVVRYFISLVHYRSPLDFNKAQIVKAGEQYEKVCSAVSLIREVAENREVKPCGEALETLNAFMGAMQEDFNSPLAIAELLKICKIKKEGLTKEVASQYLYFVNVASRVLGLEFKANVQGEGACKEAAELEALKQIIAEVRQDLRLEKNYALSDKIRNRLNELGIVVADKRN